MLRLYAAHEGVPSAGAAIFGPAAKCRDRARRTGAPVGAAHQAAREALSATLTPSTAAGGADGERCTGWPAAIAAATRASSTRCNSSSSRSSAATRALRARAGSRRGRRGRPVLQEPVLGAADSERRNCPGVRGFRSEVPEASMSGRRNASVQRKRQGELSERPGRPNLRKARAICTAPRRKRSAL